MLAVLNGLLPLKCLVYLDDVLVMGRTVKVTKKSSYGIHLEFTLKK